MYKMRNMQKMISHNDFLEKRGMNLYSNLGNRPIFKVVNYPRGQLNQIIYKNNINRSLSINGLNEKDDLRMNIDSVKTLMKSDMVKNQDSQYEDYDRLKMDLEKLLNSDRDYEMLLEERSIEVDFLKERLEILQKEMEECKIFHDCEIMTLETQMRTSKSEYDAERLYLYNQLYYYKVRMEQERQLNRQVMEQLEELKSIKTPFMNVENVEEINDGDVRDENRIDGDDSMITEVINAPCIVCSEKHRYYVPIPCNHPICNDCYVHWYASRVHYNDTRLDGEHAVIFGCPLCRTPIDVN